VATRVGTSAGQEYQSASSPEFAFTFGLDRILAGIAELIPAKNSEENTNHCRSFLENRSTRRYSAALCCGKTRVLLDVLPIVRSGAPRAILPEHEIHFAEWAAASEC